MATLLTENQPSQSQKSRKPSDLVKYDTMLDIIYKFGFVQQWKPMRSTKSSPENHFMSPFFYMLCIVFEY